MDAQRLVNDFCGARFAADQERLVSEASARLEGLEGVESGAEVGVQTLDGLRAVNAGDSLLCGISKIVPGETTFTHEIVHRLLRCVVFEGLVVDALINQGPRKACVPDW